VNSISLNNSLMCESRLTSIAILNNNKIKNEIDRLETNFNLLLSMHLALYRTKCPLLHEFETTLQGESLGEGEDIIFQAVKLRETIMCFRRSEFTGGFQSLVEFHEKFARRLGKVFDGELSF